jgi:RNA methyltransferase, TrmH family
MIPVLSKNRLKFLNKLKQKKFRDSENLFIISGLRAVKMLLENPVARPVEAIFTPGRQEMAVDIFKGSGHVVPQFELPEKDFQTLVEEKTPQGICLVAQKPDTSFAPEKVTGTFVLFLDRISDPGNLGTILRSAEWFGFATVLLSKNSADPFQPKAVRSSAGTLLNLTILENVEAQQLRELKKEKGFKAYATVIKDGSDISKIEFAGKSIIMLGSEADGLDSRLEKLSDEKISITRIGSGESLNLANAASIIMYQAVNNKK